VQTEKLQSNKSPAPGGLQPALLKEFNNEAAELPAKSNLSLKATAARERSLFCSVLNLKRYEKDCGNYRADSFILAPSKLAEEIIKARVEMPVLQCDRLRTTAHGFCTGNPV